MEQLLKAAVSKSNELQPTVSPAVLLKGKKTKSRGTDYVILTSCCGPHLDGPQTPGLWSTFGPLARCLETWFKGTVTFLLPGPTTGRHNWIVPLVIDWSLLLENVLCPSWLYPLTSAPAGQMVSNWGEKIPTVDEGINDHCDSLESHLPANG